MKTIFATKDDVKKFATKVDLKDFATKDDLKNFATKDDLIGVVRFSELDKRLEKTEKRLGNKYDKVITILQKVAGDLKTKRETQEIHGQQHKDINDALEKHDQRLTKLESQVGISAI